MSATRQLNITVTEKAYQKISEMAAAANMRPTTYANILFDAAYAARVGSCMDESVDAMVGRVIVLWGAGIDAERIARSLDISVGWVAQVIDAWREEVRGRA